MIDALAHRDTIGPHFRWLLDESGQDVVEYGLLIATIAIVVLIGISLLGSSMSTWFQVLAGQMTTTGTAT
ncbi:MAG: hypothetical protein NVSMB2_09320 [Chloroflexota bacterium]